MRTENQMRLHSKMRSLKGNEYFLSGTFRNRLDGINRYLVGYRCQVPVDIYESSDPNETAHTDSTGHVYINLCNPFTEKFSSFSEKYQSIRGLDFHEVAHVLFTDFGIAEKAFQEYLSGNFWPEEPVPHSPAEEKALLEMKEMLAHREDSSYRLFQISLSFLKQLWNILEDAYVEHCLCSQFGSFIEESIALNNSVMQEVDVDSCHDFSDHLNLLLMYSVNGKEPVSHQKGNPFIALFGRIKPLADRCIHSGNTVERLRAGFQILLVLWEDLKAEAKAAEQKANPSLGDGTTDKEIMQQILQEMFSGVRLICDDANANPLSRNLPIKSRCSIINTAPDGGIPNIPYVIYSGDEAERTEKLEDNINLARKEAAIEEISQEIAASSQERLERLFSGDPIHDVPRKIMGEEITPLCFQRYQKEKKEIQTISKRLAFELDKVLEKRNGGKLAGLALGPRLGKNFYREDKRFFTRNIAPEEIPLAVGLLVDLSGSMDHEVNQVKRIDIARKTAAILYSFCELMEIPITVYGHDTRGNMVVLHSFVEFSSVDNRDAIRIMGMDVGGSNRDGLALRYVSDMVAERPERKKLVILISDGLPSHGRYQGEIAYKDLREAKKENAKRGISTFVASIGADKERLKMIYGDGFLDISNARELPVKMVQLVKSFL